MMSLPPTRGDLSTLLLGPFEIIALAKEWLRHPHGKGDLEPCGSVTIEDQSVNGQRDEKNYAPQREYRRDSLGNGWLPGEGDERVLSELLQRHKHEAWSPAVDGNPLRRAFPTSGSMPVRVIRFTPVEPRLLRVGPAQRNRDSVRVIPDHDGWR